MDCVDNPTRSQEHERVHDFIVAVMIAVILILHIAIIPVVVEELRRDRG